MKGQRLKVKRKKGIGILTGGGDVPPLNAVISSVKQTSLENGFELIGFLYGWLGLLEGWYVELSKINIDPLIGGTILKSSRISLKKVSDDVERAKENFKRLNLQGLIIVGGNDTLSNSFYLHDIPQVLISKTIDNDVGIIRSRDSQNPNYEIVNYFTLGYPTASKKISSFVSLKDGLRTTAYSHDRIIVVESMGMHAGWLALSSSMGHPDFIIIPEFPLEYDRFLEKVYAKYEKQKNVIIVVAEGAKFSDNSYISADENEKDDFGHPRFKGSAEALAKKIKKDLSKYFDTRNVNAVNPSYLYRSGVPCDLDLEWAGKLGEAAARLLLEGIGKPIFLAIMKSEGKFSIEPYPLSELKSAQNLERFVTRKFYDPETYTATEDGKKYLSEIVEEFSYDDYGLE